MHGRWVSLGGLGWINVLESLQGAGAPFSRADVENLATIYRRLGAALVKLEEGDQLLIPEPPPPAHEGRAIRPR